MLNHWSQSSLFHQVLLFLMKYKSSFLVRKKHFLRLAPLVSLFSTISCYQWGRGAVPLGPRHKSEKNPMGKLDPSRSPSNLCSKCFQGQRCVSTVQKVWLEQNVIQSWGDWEMTKVIVYSFTVFAPRATRPSCPPGGWVWELILCCHKLFTISY